MINSKYTFIALYMAILLWFMESIIHRFVFSEDRFEFIPSNINELWMRVVVVLLLIFFGVYADQQTKYLLKKEKEKRAVFNSTVAASQHILNNLITQMKYFKAKADELVIYDKETMSLFEQTMEEAELLENKLSEVEELTEESITSSVLMHYKK